MKDQTDQHWPTPLQPAAYHGLLGAIVTALKDETEADPAAILVQLLVMFGNCIGPTYRMSITSTCSQ